MKDTLVSIITVCYNSEKTIERTIQSVLNQTYSNIEYIIIDGQSTDNTLNIVKKYIPSFDNRLKIVSEKDQGIYDAMNKGIKMAKGSVIGIINSDDYYEKDAVENIVNAMTEDKYQVIYGMLRSWRNGKIDSVQLLSHHFMKERMIAHPSSFVTKEVYSKYGVFDTQYTSAADYDFMLRVSEMEEVKFNPVEIIIANFDQGGMCFSKKGRMDKNKMLRDHGLISKTRYFLEYIRLCLRR